MAGKWDKLDIPHFEGTNLSGTKYENKFLSPVNWLTEHAANAANNATGAAADRVNLVTSSVNGAVSNTLRFLNSMMGGAQVCSEYQTGGDTETYKIEQAILQDTMRNPLTPGQKAVSYTHLDVYKRQGHKAAPRRNAPAHFPAPGQNERGGADADRPPRWRRRC